MVSWLQDSLTASPLTSLSVGPPAGNGAELQFAFAPFQPPELAGLNLVLQVLGGLEQGGFERIVSGLGVQGRAMDQQRRLARMADRLGVHTGAGYLQPHLHAEGRFDFPLVFEDHFSGGYRRQAMQVFELFLHLAVPGDLGVEAEIAKGGFHIRSGMGLQLRSVYAGRMAPLTLEVRVDAAVHSAFVPVGQIV